MYKQIIIVRKDLNMSPGKLAAQVSHGSMAFLTNMIREHTQKISVNVFPAYTDSLTTGELVPQLYKRSDLHQWAEQARKNGERVFYATSVNPAEPNGELRLCDPQYEYQTTFDIDTGIYEQWINDAFTKCILEAKNKNQLLKAKSKAEELGMKEGTDFFLIKDACRTELEPEDEDGTLTCIGFRPMEDTVIDPIGKKYQLYR